MKKIIDGKRYDTETATLIGEHEHSNRSDFGWYEEGLYQKRTGEFFLAGRGGPQTKYSRSIDQNSWSGGEGIFPLSVAEAKEWAEAHLTADEYESVFEVEAEESENTVGKAIEKIRLAADITQAQLATLVGTTPAMIGRYERGLTSPSIYRVKDLAKALNISPMELIG